MTSTNTGEPTVRQDIIREVRGDKGNVPILRWDFGGGESTVLALLLSQWEREIPWKVDEIIGVQHIF